MPLRLTPGAGGRRLEYVVIDNSRDDEYHSQLNNRHVPRWSCGPTSAINSLRAAGITLPDTGGAQPEDALVELLTTPEAYDRMDAENPGYRAQGYEPYMVHSVLEWGVNRFIGRAVDVFSTNWTLRHLLIQILEGRTLVMSGPFTGSGHMVSVVGVTVAEHDWGEDYSRFDLGRVGEVIVDDPYGDYHDGYRSPHGNGIRFSLEEFNRLTNARGRRSEKWAHVIGD